MTSRTDQVREDIRNAEYARAISDVAAVALLTRLNDGEAPESVESKLRNALAANGYGSHDVEAWADDCTECYGTGYVISDEDDTGMPCTEGCPANIDRAREREGVVLRSLGA